jgi:hypothetical protein
MEAKSVAHGWTDKQISAGRRAEEQRRRAFFAERNRKGIFGRRWEWLVNLWRNHFGN